MSGGRLVVMDRGGRDVKRYPLASGLATLGSGAACDIRVMLASVSSHHATIAVHNSQTVIRNVGDGETIVNGQGISVAALRHGDIITLGDRSLRWEYSVPNKRHQGPVDVAPLGRPGVTSSRGGRVPRRSAAGPLAVRDRALQLDIELRHRVSMPASSGGKQVAIVQPQRRDPSGQTGNVPPSPASPACPASPARRSQHSEAPAASTESYSDKRNTRLSPNTVPANSTKATLWIESRRRRSMPPKRPHTPLRLAVLKKAQSAHKLKVVKIEAPLKIDHTKQAAIMLMTGHTPKSRLSLIQTKKSPSYVIKKSSPVRKTSGRKSRQSGRRSTDTGDGITPKRASTYSQDSRNKRSSANKSTSPSEPPAAVRSVRSSPRRSPPLPSPKKSALKDHSKRGSRKTESIKFDLSNLEGHRESEITGRFESEDGGSESELALHFSSSSIESASPPPHKSTRSRGGRMLERLGAAVLLSPSPGPSPAPPPPPPPPSPGRRSARSTMLLQKALNRSDATAFRSRSRPSGPGNSESYSIVDLVSIDSDPSNSVYDSADSVSAADYETPNTTGRRTRSTIDPTLLSSSTPYVARSRSGPPASRRPPPDAPGRSKSSSTPEDRRISANESRVSRASKSRSRINDSDLQLLDETEPEDTSPKTSRRTKTKSNMMESSKVNDSTNGPEKDGASTPENGRSPVDVGTPVLSIRSLLDSSRSSDRSRGSTKKAKKSVDYKRKTVGVLSEPKRRPGSKSKSLGVSARQTILRLSKDSSETSHRTDEGASQPDNEDTVTPKSAVKLVQETVKNKHSTAKKPQSKRSMIDDLDRSDIVKQLFNSPVKRKLSQSMTEFSRKQLFDDDEIVIAKQQTRNTIASMGRSVDVSISEGSGTFTPERFVSPISTPSHSPNLSGIKRLFQKNTPENDLTNVRGVKSLLRTHRTRRSVKNDLTNVTGLKLMFANTPKNLSDVRVKEVFKPSSPKNDLRRVSGVKSLFQRETSPKNDLTDVRGVKKLFRKSPENDLRHVSGVKRTLRQSPRNDLTDVRGVRRMFRNRKDKESLHDVSGIEELFNTSTQSTQNSEALFDNLVGKPLIKAVYSKTFSTKLIQKPKNRKPKTLHSSLEGITNDVEGWLEQELQKRFHRDEPSTSNFKNTSRNTTKELQNLVTSTVEGEEPVRASRTRNSSMKKSASETYSAHTLPIKKRSLVECSVQLMLPKLPIKKRAVVHSTPVKGRVNITMNASELGRVSPIAAVDKTNVDHDTSLTRTTRQNTIPEEPKSRAPTPKTSQKPLAKPSPKASSRITKVSPKASPKKVVNSPPKRVTRNRKSTSENAKKRRTSLVISKKAPVMSPKADLKDTQESPKKRVTRGQKAQRVETPKRTRVKAQKATVVVPKPSPKLKPQAKGKQPPVEEQKTRRTRKNTAPELVLESPKKSQPRKTRGKQSEPKDKENISDNVIEKVKRGRKTAVVEKEPIPTKRGRDKETNVQEAKTRGKSVTKTDEKQPRTRGKKVETQASVQSEPTTRRGRKNTENVSLKNPPKTRGNKAEAPVENKLKTRGKKIETQSSVQSEPATRGRRTKVVENAVIPETKGRKRKTIATEEVPPKISKTVTRRGRKAAGLEETAVGDTASTTTAAKDQNVISESKTRGRPKNVAEPQPVPAKATRGKKAAEPKEIPAADKRKRKTKVETSPVKGHKSAESKKPRPERSRTQPADVVAGRSRRR